MLYPHVKNFLVAWNLLEVMINTENLQKASQAPLKWDGRLVWCNELSELHDYKWELASLMDALILHHIDVPPPTIRCMHTISTIGSMLHDNVYDVIVGCYLACTCFDFIFMLHYLLFERKVITFHASIFVSSLLKGFLWCKFWSFYLPINMKLEWNSSFVAIG
jgi:hypothetical protein